ncbi:MAG: pyridoxamine 5'-phosphate oxidase family protein [Pseudanabaenaceae cyanobacterium bins.39]|nr:pyridoxamine 5'-phosphate oxidase family protein [Pseudanabaenaceae cyanobacterium bins.39]
MHNWRSPLARCLHQHRNQPESRYIQLATVDLEQRPRNRTVVFRGFVDDCQTYQGWLKIVSDHRSQKFQQIQHNPWAEVSWYFPKTRSQFRILGKMLIIDQQDQDLERQNLRTRSWQGLSDAAKHQFAWEHPKELRQDSQHITEVAIVDPHHPLDWFCLLLLEPVEVDRLELRGTPQNRWIYRQDNQQNWIEQEVNP